MVGSQKDITLHAEAIIMYFGLNWKEKSESVLSPSPAYTDLDTLHWILVVSIENTNLLTVFWVPNVNPAIAGAGDDELGVRRERSLKWKLFRVEMACKRMQITNMFTEDLCISNLWRSEGRIRCMSQWVWSLVHWWRSEYFSRLGRTSVQSTPILCCRLIELSWVSNCYTERLANWPWNLKEENGPLSKDLRSYSFTQSELMPAANMRPSGSKAATGRPESFIKPCTVRVRSWSVRSVENKPDNG